MTNQNRFKQGFFNWSKKKWSQEINNNFPILGCYENWLGMFIVNKMKLLSIDEQFQIAFQLLRKNVLNDRMLNDPEIYNLQNDDNLQEEIVQKKLELQQDSYKFDKFNAKKIAKLINQELSSEFTKDFKYFGSSTSWQSIINLGGWKLKTNVEVYGKRRAIIYTHNFENSDLQIQTSSNILESARHIYLLKMRVT